MLEKRDVLNYKKLGYAFGGLGIGILFFCFVAGVAAKYHMTLTHLYVPYWLGIILILQGASALGAVRTGKRWPLAFWIPLFIMAMAGICTLAIILAPYKIDFYDRFPCLVQKEMGSKFELQKNNTRCICSFDQDEYLTINGQTTIVPCMRALTILNVTSNINFLLAAVAIIPNLLMFVLVCNDLCCLSCRRAALIPQVIVTQGPQQQAQYVPVQAETVTYRTDEQPGSSSGQRLTDDQAGPLPTKNHDNVPHAF